ncbi:movement protein [Sesamum angolense]|uniref:Movement protein n=1 Tax=Sesamum angolense TaxID=2727404 RepID=A0AAE2BLZ1_9LAMI|nr:movement protein [Sesamum angolense]
MRESADFHTNTTPTFVGTRLRENLGRNPRRAPENTPWARTMLQPLHPYGAVLNLDVIDFRNMEKLIDEWIGWDNTPADTKASILAGDSKSAIADRLGRLMKIHFIGDGYFEESRTEKARENAQALFSLELRTPMFFAKICSPWREMLIQSYKVPEEQMDSVARRMSFLKDKLKDWCYQASIQKNMKRLRGILEELLSGADHGGPKPKPEHTNLGNGVDQQGFHPKDLDDQIQDPPDEPLRRELSDGPIPELMKVSKIATARHVEQEDISLQTARRNVVKSEKNLLDFKRKDLMKEGNRPYSITYRIAYALSNTHHSDLFLRKEYIEIPRIFKEFAKVMAPDPIRIPRIGGVDIIIKDHPVLDRTISSRIEYGSRMSFSEDRITGYKGKEKDLARVLTPQEIRQPVIGRYEGMLEIAGHEFLVAGVAGRENGCVTLGLSFLEDHKPWGRKEYFAAYIDSGSGICTAKPGVFPKEARETLPVIVLRREKAFNRIMPINFRSKRGDFDAKLTNPKMQDKRKFGKVLLSFRQQGLIDSDSLYEESEEEIKNLREALVELKTMDISEESIFSLENVKRLIQRNFSENPLAWWDRNKIEATLKIKEECKYDSPGFLVRNHGEIKRGKPRLIKMESESKKFTAFSTPQGILIDEAGIELQEHIVEKIRNFPDVLKDKKQLQSFLGVVNFAVQSGNGRKSTQRVRELKQVCNNLPKLAIPQDEDELVVYTDANDYRWAAVLMKKTTTGEEPCRYTGGLFTE